MQNPESPSPEAAPADDGELPEMTSEGISEELAEGLADALASAPEPLAEAMRHRGFAALTSVQSAALDAASEGRDLRISSQTGSGKTVAIGLALAPRLLEATVRGSSQGPEVLVLVPTRELAMQVREELTWLYSRVRGIGIAVVMGGTSLDLERRALSRGPRVVVGTPGRTLDHLRTGALDASSVGVVVLDESDRMLDMGFREELDEIMENMPKERSTHLVSATFPAAVRKLADRIQKQVLTVEGTALGAANEDIQHIAHVIDRRQTYAALVNLLLLNDGGRCLIFVERRVDVASLAEKLSGDGFPVQSFSGELAQAQRTRTLNAFRNGTIRTLVSTDVAARGIDVPDIELVIHVDTPKDAESYTHRSGRTGRAGREGRSVMLVTPRARRHVERLLRSAKIESLWTPAPTPSKVRKKLRKRFRQDLYRQLSSEEPPSQKQIDYAKGLLDGRDPAEVVAMLLDVAQPAPIREPMKVDEPPAAQPSARRDPNREFVRFSINWGAESGAATNRLLGHICRRGQLKSHLIGSIEIGAKESSFDVEASAAARFERLVAKPDRRDPDLWIKRVGAPHGAGPGGPRRNHSGDPRKKQRFDPKRRGRS